MNGFKQLDFDFPKWDERRRLLDETSLSSEERQGMGRLLLKSILERIGSTRESCEAQKTWANALGVSRETVNRAIKVLVKHDLITVERKYTPTYGKVLNHHRVNWTELHRRFTSAVAARPTENSSTTNVRIYADQCEDSRRTNVRIYADQCEDSRRTNVRIYAVRNRVDKEELTTTEWEVVVVPLGEIVDRVEEAIANIQRRGGTPTEAMSLIARWRALPESDSRKKPGTLFNWFRRAPKPDSPEPAQTNKAQSEEKRRATIRTEICREWQKLGKWDDPATTNAVIEAEIDRRLALANESRKIPTATT
jgi:hypothetical protein